ncbi:MAG: hypothetical protein P1S60_15940 [Anaerolineae bacterium]|nr:hypothetical protein [Anaerolineae bacterium]
MMELEFENLKAYEKFWTAWGNAPETPAFMKKWFKATKGGGTNEIWDLVE